MDLYKFFNKLWISFIIRSRFRLKFQLKWIFKYIQKVADQFCKMAVKVKIPIEMDVYKCLIKLLKTLNLLYLINNFKLCTFGKVKDTSFTCTINAVFSKYLFFIFFKVTKNNFIVFNKICLLNNLIFLEQRLSTCKDSYNYTLLFYTLLFYTPYLSNR